MVVVGGLHLSWTDTTVAGSAALANPDHRLRYLVALASRVALTPDRGSEMMLRSQLSRGHIPAL